MSDPTNPQHYRKHPSGVECIQITEHMNFNRGNAVKYLWRAGEKDDEAADLKKARWYIDREIERVERMRVQVGYCYRCNHKFANVVACCDRECPKPA